MIIVVCTDDPGLIGIARASERNNSKAFGVVHRVFDKVISQLKPDENLFIIAHGAFEGDEDKPVIGDKVHDFFLPAGALFESIRHLFPPGYKGRIFIDACESAKDDEATMSFAELFYYLCAFDHLKTSVSGRNGLASGLIATADDMGWTTFPR